MESASPQPLPKEYVESIVASVVFYVITCGVYGYYWKYRQFKAMNALLGRDQFYFLDWLILTVVTFGLYDVYYEYRLGRELERCLAARGLDATPGLAVIGAVLSGIGIWRVGMALAADAIYQHELNRMAA